MKTANPFISAADGTDMDNQHPPREAETERLNATGVVSSQGFRLKKKWLLLLLASVLLSLAVPFAWGGLAQFKLLHRLTWWAVLSLATLAIISWVFNALRTRLLMAALDQKVSFFKAALTTISAEFAGVTTPGSVGMAATYTFLFHNLGVTLGEAVGLVSVIMVTDLVYFGSVMTLAILMQIFSPSGLHHTLKLVSVLLLVMVGGGLVLTLLALNFRRVYRFVSRQMAKVSWLAGKRYRLARFTVHFLRALRLLKKMSWPKLIWLYCITLGFWLPRYLVLVLVIIIVGQTVPLSYLLLVQGVLNLGGQALLMPGGGGTVDAGYVAFLSPYLHHDALAFTLLVWRSFTFYWLLILGGPIFIFETGEAAHNLLTRKN